MLSAMQRQKVRSARFVKSNDNPVLQKNVEQGGIVTGTGHNSVTWSKDGKQMYCVYHGYTQKTGSERVVFYRQDGNR